MQVTVVSLELAAASMPPGKKLVMHLADPVQTAGLKKNPFTIKEGVEYKCVRPSLCTPTRRLIVPTACASHSRSTTVSSL